MNQETSDRRKPDASLTLAVDAESGRNGTDGWIPAVAAASTVRHVERSVYFVLVGDENRLTEELVQVSHNPEHVSVHHVPPEQDRNTEDRRSATATACALAASDEVDAAMTAAPPLSSANAALSEFSVLDEVAQPAMPAAVALPRPDDRDVPPLLLDVGASNEASAEALRDFGLMGAAYVDLCDDIDRPRVALLAQSERADDAPTRVAAATEQLEAAEPIDFVGLTPARALPEAEADVFVCDGFVGSIALDLIRGLSELTLELADVGSRRRSLWASGFQFLAGSDRQRRGADDESTVSAVPLLGFEETLVVADARARRADLVQSLGVAVDCLDFNLASRIADAIEG